MNIRLLLSVLLIITLAGCSSVELSDLTIRNNRHYKGNSSQPYSGKVVSHYATANKQGKPRLHMEGSMKNGLKEGKWITYKWNGGRLVARYKAGRLHGKSELFDRAGTIRHLKEYTHGRLDGMSVDYNRAGEEIKTAFYKDGALIPIPPPGDKKDIMRQVEQLWDTFSEGFNQPPRE